MLSASDNYKDMPRLCFVLIVPLRCTGRYLNRSKFIVTVRIILHSRNLLNADIIF